MSQRLIVDALTEDDPVKAQTQSDSAPVPPLLLLTLLLGGTVISFSNSALNPAIPVFMSVFSVNVVVGSWVLNAYILAMSVGLMLSGYLSSKYSSRHLYSASIGLFTLGALLGVFAQNMDTIIIARAIQGLAGGITIPLSIGLLYRFYPAAQHGRVMALWGVVVMLSLALGPLLGAILVAQLAWWSLFAVTLPIGVLTMLLAYAVLPRNDADRQASSFDGRGFVLLLGGFGLLMFGLQRLGQASISAGWVVAFIALQIVIGIIWWRYEYQHDNPLIKVRLLGNRTYLYSTIISVSQTIGMLLCLLLLPIIIQEVMQEDAIWTGWVLMVGTLVASLTTHVAGRIVDKQGARLIGMIGIGVSAVATLLLGAVMTHPSLLAIMLLMCLRGVGVGLAYLPTTTVGFSSLPKQQVTDGAALNNISRRICSAVVIVQVGVYIDMRQQQLTQSTSISEVSANLAQATAIQEVFMVVAVLLLLTLPIAAKLPAYRTVQAA